VAGYVRLGVLAAVLVEAVLTGLAAGALGGAGAACLAAILACLALVFAGIG